nr:hypothetical protein [uncultured Pedobacter sp.]
MTVTQQPASVNFTGNLPDVLIDSTEIVDILLLFNGDEVLQETYRPSSDGKIVIKIKDLLDDLLSLQIPEFNIAVFNQANAYADINLKINGGAQELNFKVIKGGVDASVIDVSEFLGTNFLTWQPQQKFVKYTDPEWLSYYATLESELKLKAYYQAENETITLATLPAGELSTVNVNYGNITSLLNAQPLYFDVWIEVAGVIKSFVQRYVLSAEEFEADDVFVFANSLGGIDTIRFFGEKQETNDYKFDSALFDEDTLDYDIEINQVFSKNSGYFRSQRNRVWSLEFFKSLQKYFIRSGALSRIVVTKPKLESVSDELAGYTFDFALSRQTNFLNLSRADELPTNLQIIGPNDELFFLAPRLSEFPQANFNDILFAVQSPYDSKWYRFSLSDILNTFQEQDPTVPDYIKSITQEDISRWNAGGGIVGDVYTKQNINDFFSGGITITGYNKTNWDTAYSWGNHASAGYATESWTTVNFASLTGYNKTNWDTAYSWGNHASVGYATESWTTANFASLTGYNKTNWDSAYSWGNHSSAGYATEAYTIANFQPLEDQRLSTANSVVFAEIKAVTKLEIPGTANTWQIFVDENATGGTANPLPTGYLSTLQDVDISGRADGLMIYWDATALKYKFKAGGSDYSLPTASASILGGVKIGSGLTIDGAGVISVTALGGVTSFNTRTGAISLNSGDVTGALGFTPYNSTNPDGYITASAITGKANIDGSNATGTWGINTTGYATILKSNHIYPNNISDSTSASSLSDGSFTTVSMHDSPSIFGSGQFGTTLTMSGYDKYGATQISALYNASTPRLAVRNFNQGLNNWNSWRELQFKDELGSAAYQASTRFMLDYTYLGTASMNFVGQSGIYRNETGVGGNYAYSGVLHIQAGDTGWQLQSSFAGSDYLRFRGTGANGNNYSAWSEVFHSNNVSYVKETLGLNNGSTLTNNISGNAANANALSTIPVDFGSYATGVQWIVGSNNVDGKLNPVSTTTLQAFLGLNGGSTLTNNISGNAATATNATSWGGRSANLVGNWTSSFQYPIGLDQADGTVKLVEVAPFQTWLGLGSNAYTSTAYMPVTGGTLSGNLTIQNNTLNLTTDDPTVGGKIYGYNSTTSAPYGGGLKFQTRFYNGSAYNYIDRLTINDSGYVGIGTTNPMQNFVVSHNGALGLEVYDDYVNNKFGLQVYNRSTNAYGIMEFAASEFVFANSNLIVNAGYGVGFKLLDGFNIYRQNGYTGFEYGNSEKMKLSATGLEVIGSVSADRFQANTDGFKSYNYRGMVGDYDQNSSAEKIIWTIGDNWNTLATMYGLGYTYNNISGFGHSLFMALNGTKTIQFSLETGSASFNGNVIAGTFIGALSGNASTATKLATARTLWGQSFDGSGNVSGPLTGVTDLTASGQIISANIKATNKMEIPEAPGGVPNGNVWKIFVDPNI